MVLLGLSILFLYTISIIQLIIGNYRLQKEEIKKPENNIFISIIVPFRNEEKTLPDLISCLEAQTYPKDKYEVLFIDDHSEDTSCQLIDLSIANFSLLELSDATGKKAALMRGIKKAKGELILTTDADCILNENWIQKMLDSYVSNAADFLIGPVRINKYGLQEIEFSSLVAVTSGSVGVNKPLMCNGANLGYKKALFERVNPYGANLNVDSGDDVFFLHEIKKIKPRPKISFVTSEEALVHTNASGSWTDFLNQRVRWAKKARYYHDIDSILFGGIIGLMNVSLFILLLKGQWETLVVCFLVKLSLDVILILSARSWLGVKGIISKSILLSFVYPFYFLLFALLSLLYKPKWKGRG